MLGDIFTVNLKRFIQLPKLSLSFPLFISIAKWYECCSSTQIKVLGKLTSFPIRPPYSLSLSVFLMCLIVWHSNKKTWSWISPRHFNPLRPVFFMMPSKEKGKALRESESKALDEIYKNEIMESKWKIWEIFFLPLTLLRNLNPRHLHFYD